MTPSIINSRVLGFLHSELLTTPADIERLARYGLILVRSSDFMETVAMSFGPEAVYVLTQFYRNFLGKFDYVCIDIKPVLAIRFCNQIDDGGQDGVQLEFVPGSAKLVRLTASFGTTTFAHMQEYRI